MPDLKELLGEDLFKQVNDKIADANKDAENEIKLMVNDGSFVPRDRLNEKSEKIELLEKQIEQKDEVITQRDQQLEQLKNDTQVTEELKQKVEEYQTKNTEMSEQLKTQETEFQEQLKQQKLNDQIALAIEKADPRDDVARKAILSSLDREKIELGEDGTLKGVDDQIKNLRENADYLFGKEKIVGGNPDDGDPTPPTPDPDDMTDAEYIKYREEQMKKD